MKKQSRFAGRFGALLVVAFCAGGPTGAVADAQDDRIKALEQSLARSTAVIEALAARVAELERSAARAAAPVQAAQAGASAPVASRDDQARAIEALQQDVNHIVDTMGKGSSETGAAVHGFIDVGAGWSSAQDPRRERGFNAGSLDIYLTPQIGERVKSLIELVVESSTEGVELDLERIQLGYTFSDAVTLWGGRFHSPFGQWNTDFHHGANLQTSISRPDVIEFEDRGGLVPAHSVGLWLTGKSRLDVGRLNYDLYLANGPSIRDRQLDPGVLTDSNADKMLGFRLGYEANQGLGGLAFGLHGFASDVTSIRSTTPCATRRGCACSVATWSTTRRTGSCGPSITASATAIWTEARHGAATPGLYNSDAAWAPGRRMPATRVRRWTRWTTTSAAWLRRAPTGTWLRA